MVNGLGCTTGTGCTSSLDAGKSATYSVLFAPTTITPISSGMTISASDPQLGTYNATFTFSGRGAATALTTVPDPGGTLAFGAQPVGTDSAVQGIVVTDQGSNPVNITSATLAGSDFVVKSGSTGAQTVFGGNTASWTIACHPGSRGARTGTFTIANDSSNVPSYVVNLTCNGTGASLVTQPSSIAFGTVAEGQLVTKTFVLTNNGEATATIGTAAIAPTGVGYSVSGVPASLAANANATVTMTFAPNGGADGGAATLTIPSNAVGAPTLVPITGTGVPNGVAVTCPECAGNPMSMAFGDVRWDDASRSEVFTIANTSAGDVTISSVALTSPADFRLSGAPSTPFVLHRGGAQAITVTAAPSGALLGAATSTLEITTNLAPPMAVIDRPLSMNVISAALGVAPGMSVDFGGVDVSDHTALTETITLTNTGDAPMHIEGAPALSGVFTSAPLPAQTVPVGGSATVDVAYLPTVVKPASAGDSATLLVTIDDLFASGSSQPDHVAIQLAGHGTGRQISVDGPLHFPDTYRNPSTADAPIAAVIVRDTGEAPLTISSATLSDSPAFTLVDRAPITIAGGSSAPVRVRFAPTTDTGTFTATLSLTEDDPATPQVVVAIDGRAISRMIAIAPSTLDLGAAHAGTSVRLSDEHAALAITNTDPTHTIRVRELRVTDGADTFRVVSEAGETLGPGEQAPFDIEFAPTDAGAFTGTIEVLLDDDTVPDATVALSGRGLAPRETYYGCQTGGSSGGGATLLVVLVLAARRRRDPFDVDPPAGHSA
jgi:MYXO-CTERM domain-containing protein